MGSKAEPEASSTPKLSLFSLPMNQSPEPPGMLTPPLRPPASVPFLWEEAPGKPRTSDKPRSDTARCLELPPRLLTEVKITNLPSPTTVLEGPYIVGRSSSYSASFSRLESTERGQLVLGHSKRENYKERGGGGGYFGSWGKRTFKGNGQIAEDNFVISPCSSSLSSSVFINDAVDDVGGGGGGGGGGGVGGGGGENTKVKITRFRRRGSFLSLSSTRVHPSLNQLPGLRPLHQESQGFHPTQPKWSSLD
ncbi:Protein of unknown function DUF688 [Macleaya cordata]|uniref:Uncharacterized protein n=1 Tax=Macleaya cordata TaxID=56857 RepID=A0A200QCN1_MACCD|nr:Protein of unknown function DUF688 [Macleaya cordata]